MRVTIVIEDTSRGIATKARVDHNGCLDHASQSLALGQAALLERQIKTLTGLKVLISEDGLGFPQARIT